MKINEVKLYKTQLDNSYRNVIDFHNFTKTGVNINDDIMDATDIKRTRFRYFNSLTYLELTLGTGIKSVKVEGSFITITVSGLWENIRDYNYITLRLKNTALRDVEYISETYCFISSYTSSNDSDTPSTTIVCEIDYWTTYIDTILLNTPMQNELYAHTDPTINNSLTDDRIPNEFIMTNTYDYLIDDAILFLVMDVDADHSPITSPIEESHYKFDTAATTFTRIYIPILTIQRNGQGNIYSKLIVGTWKDNSTYQDYTNEYKQHGFFGGFDSQYIYGAFFTFVTPIGIMKASIYTQQFNDASYLKCAGWNVGQSGVFTVNYGNTIIYGYNGTKVFLFGRNQQQLLPVNNTQDSVTIASPFSASKDINSAYLAQNEVKLYQYPYYQKVMCYKGQEYNITPEPNGSIATPTSTVTFMRLNGISMKIENTLNIANTLLFNLSDNDTLPTSVDAYQRYRESGFTADFIKSISTAVTATGAGIAMAPATGGASLIAGLGGGASAFWNQFGTQKKMKSLPDEQATPSSNSFDFLPTMFPRLKTKQLKSEDKELVTTIWRKYGYPVKSLQYFHMRRFWYDYKQISNPILSNITNALARKKLEDALANGITIWHINYDGTNFKYLDIGEYDINNPGRNNCKEEIQ